MTEPATKDAVVTTRMTERQREVLRAIEQEDGLSSSDVLRQLVNDEGRRRGAGKTWLMRDFVAVVASGETGEFNLLAALLCRIAREAGERFEAKLPLSIKQTSFQTGGASDMRVRSVSALMVFDEIDIRGARPAVGISAVRAETGFEVRVRGSPGATRPAGSRALPWRSQPTR